MIGRTLAYRFMNDALAKKQALSECAIPERLRTQSMWGSLPLVQNGELSSVLRTSMQYKITSGRSEIFLWHAFLLSLRQLPELHRHGRVGDFVVSPAEKSWIELQGFVAAVDFLYRPRSRVSPEYEGKYYHVEWLGLMGKGDNSKELYAIHRDRKVG